jgi:hypothetical protein
MTLEEIRKNLKTFKKCALSQIENAIENWVDDYCEEEDPNFGDINPDTIKEELLANEDLIEEIAESVAVLVQIKMVND